MCDIAEDGCWLPVFVCFLLSGLFVGSLYVWDPKYDRNHPSTIKKRFCSVFFVILISPFILKFFITSAHLKKFSIFELLGFKLPGLIPAVINPLLLTVVLFLGPLCMLDGTLIWRSTVNKNFWISNVTNLVWLRNILVGPLAEEFTFRACMVPLLLQCLSPGYVIFVCSLFFGIAHVHHFVERYKAGDPFNALFKRTLIQFSYTTLFGAYSAFVFLRTGHFIAPFILHVFCNLMSLPDFGGIFYYETPKRIFLIFICISGMILWYLLLPHLLSHRWYSNYVFYNEVQP